MQSRPAIAGLFLCACNSIQLRPNRFHVFGLLDFVVGVSMYIAQRGFELRWNQFASLNNGVVSLQSWNVGQMRIGIVGSGMAGLSAAWFFDQAGATVTLLEKNARIGMDAHRVVLTREGDLLEPSNDSGSTTNQPSPSNLRADVPPRMFNRSQWPNLFRLYELLGVEIESVDFQQSFGQTGTRSAWMKLGKNFQPKLSAKLVLDPSVRQIMSDIARMMKAAPGESELPTSVTMGQYLLQNSYSEPFVKKFLYPALSATVCTCSYEALDQYPATTLLRAMLDLTKPEGLFRTRFGTGDVVNRLTKGSTDLRLSTNVESVIQQGSQVVVSIGNAERSELLEFDHVVVATQANAAPRLLGKGCRREVEALGQFKYENVSVVLHSDEALMPRRRQDWAPFNFLSNASMTSSMCSIWMNQYYSGWNLETDLFQTIMPTQPVDPERVLSQTSMQRPVVNQESLAATAKLNELHMEPDRRIWFCGSYATDGVPLLESGVVSGLNVAKRLGFDWPAGENLASDASSQFPAIGST